MRIAVSGVNSTYLMVLMPDPSPLRMVTEEKKNKSFNWQLILLKWIKFIWKALHLPQTRRSLDVDAPKQLTDSIELFHEIIIHKDEQSTTNLRTGTWATIIPLKSNNDVQHRSPSIGSTPPNKWQHWVAYNIKPPTYWTKKTNNPPQTLAVAGENEALVLLLASEAVGLLPCLASAGTTAHFPLLIVKYLRSAV